jgi:pimeloyl-ACP methyl ester carboxylesterase
MNESNQQRPVVVCLHGSASNSGMWRDLRSAVRDRALVITPELPARGKLAEDVGSVLRQLGPQHRAVDIVAHGRGCAVAARVAVLRPERVSSLVFYEPAGVPESLARRIRTPLRVLCGTKTWGAAKRAAETLVDAIAGAHLLQLVGLRHMAPLTHPQPVNNVILDFILPVSMPEHPQAA